MRAFTLIELMVVLIIFLILATAIYGVLSIGGRTWYNAGVQVELQQETRKAMEKMVKELRESASDKITISGDGSAITFQIPVDYDNDGIWVDADGDGQRDADEYAWDFIDGSGNIEWGAPLHFHCRNPRCESTAGEYNSCHYQNYAIRYLVSGGQLLRRVVNVYPGGTLVIKEEVMANNIRSASPPPDALKFTGSPAVSPAAIAIEITAQKDTPQGRTEQSCMHSQVTLRN